jgi:hypothetical protein
MKTITLKYTSAVGEESMQVPADETPCYGAFCTKDGATVHVLLTESGVQVEIKAAPPLRVYAEDDPDYTPDDPEL